MFSADEYTATVFILRTCITLLHRWWKSKHLVRLVSLAPPGFAHVMRIMCVLTPASLQPSEGKDRVSTTSGETALQKITPCSLTQVPFWFQMLELMKHKEIMMGQSLVLQSNLAQLKPFKNHFKISITLRTDPVPHTLGVTTLHLSCKHEKK